MRLIPPIRSRSMLQSRAISINTARAITPKQMTTNDNVPHTSDAFPRDPSESADTRGDGIGNNAETGDDNAGQSDIDESACGSDPLSSGSSPGKMKVMMGQEKAHGPNDYCIADRHRPHTRPLSPKAPSAIILTINPQT